MSALAFLSISLAFCVLVPLLVNARKHQKKIAYPPGPRGLPLIGNLLDLPKEQAWLTYRRWAEDFGSDLIYVRALGNDILIVDSLERTRELFQLLEYSDRPRNYAMNHTMKATWVTALMDYGPEWKVHRRCMYQYFELGRIKRYEEAQYNSAKFLLQQLLDDPNRFSHHLEHMAAQVVMKVAYGIDIAPIHDPYVALAVKVGEGISFASQPLGMLQDNFPIFRWIPSWLPGGDFNKRAREYGIAGQRMVKEALEATKASIEKGSSEPSVAASSLTDVKDGKFDGFEDVVEGVPATMLTGGVDTTVSPLRSFIRAMAVHPHVQQRAQQEIDSVTSSKRLPTFEDEGSLRYISAIVKEILRWEPVATLGGPRRTAREDYQGGFYIPKGCIVLPNAWSMLHDPKMYPNPEIFSPERFMDPKMSCPDPEFAFGFGRRICPGRQLARQMLFITIACILAVFDIKKVRDENGTVLDPQSGMTDGTVSAPVQFEVDIVPRTSSSMELI